jgi:predicted nuclease of predicted toxin-antitoxin system
LRFLLDVNIGSTVARALRDAGHDVVRAAITYPTASDAAILGHATRECRILVTRDGDFGGLIFQNGAAPPPAVIYIRFEPSDIAQMVSRLMAVLDNDRLRDHMTVIGPDHDRRRPFPVRSEDHG